MSTDALYRVAQKSTDKLGVGKIVVSINRIKFAIKTGII